MIKKRIEVSGKNNVPVVFNKYYNLHIDEEHKICKIFIPRYAILQNKSTKETKDVESVSYIAIESNVNICLSGDIELNINCVINEINYPTDKELELVCRILH